MAVIIMNRFVIKPVLAPPPSIINSSEIPFQRLRTHPISNTSGKSTRACLAGSNTGFSMTALTMCRWSDSTTCLPGTHHITVRADNTPYPIRRSAMPSVRSTNLNSELEVNRGTG